jgi:hypothetical protein
MVESGEAKGQVRKSSGQQSGGAGGVGAGTVTV